MLKRITSLLAALTIGCGSQDMPLDASCSTDAGADSALEMRIEGEFAPVAYVEEFNGVYTAYPRREGSCTYSLGGHISFNNLTTGEPEIFGNYYLLLQSLDSCTGVMQVIELYDTFAVRKDTNKLVLHLDNSQGFGFLEFDYWFEDSGLNLRYTYWGDEDPATLKLEPKSPLGNCPAELGHCYGDIPCANFAYSCIPEEICQSMDMHYAEHHNNHIKEKCE